MQKIVMLSDEIIHRIRAGEVIQRPVNVVKELLENAMDAGATDIKIRIEGGGKKSIEVSDNGCGMSQEDARICLLAHTTSKVKSIEDLSSISSLGFRGEALHSMATVSLMELRTKEKDASVGTLVTNLSGHSVTKSIGCADGTHISVKSLFYNTPSRRSSLKADAAETLLITKLIGRYMIVRPGINFSYYVNNKLHMAQKVGMTEESIISSILGQDVARGLTRVDCEIEGVVVHGFIGSPNVVKRTAEGIVVAVNGRYVEDVSVYFKVIREAYRRSIQVNEFPCVILRISIDPAQIDPNIHPQKSAIGHLDEELFKRVVFESIFSSQRHIRHSDSEGFINKSSFVPRDGPLVTSEEPALDNFFTLNEDATSGIGKVEEYPQLEVPIIENEKAPEQYSLPELSVIGQYRKTYIIASTPGFLFLIDQHALHEKQLFEELCAKSQIEILKPTFPYILNMTAEESDILASSVELFKEYGLEVDRLDNNTWKCYSVPALNGNAIPEGEIISLIKDTIGNLGDKPSLDDFKNKVLAEVACKSAIRANDVLTLADMTRLVNAGRNMKDAYFCPHGRPAVKVYRETTVDKWFKR